MEERELITCIDDRWMAVRVRLVLLVVVLWVAARAGGGGVG